MKCSSLNVHNFMGLNRQVDVAGASILAAPPKFAVISASECELAGCSIAYTSHRNMQGNPEKDLLMIESMLGRVDSTRS